jgi:transcriptional regulator EpsA
MTRTTNFPDGPPEERIRILDVIQSALSVRKHIDLFHWLQGDFQHFLPHEIMLAAWGDLKLGLLSVDVISPLPHMRTGPVIERDITPFVQRLFNQWKNNDDTPVQVMEPDGFSIAGTNPNCTISDTFMRMHAAIAHGIRDERGQHYCLYTVFSPQPAFPHSANTYMDMLLPQIDTALRRVSHLPNQRQDNNSDHAIEPLQDFGLSERESEIMHWVRSGKTNDEIGMILGISTNTVKNHLQRIFRKLDVANRAQAVAKLETPRQFQLDR